MTGSPPPPPRPTRSSGNRTTLSLGGGGELTTTIKDRLANDPAWGHFAHSGVWICPFCLAGVRGHDDTRAALMRAIESHLGRRCTAWRQGAGQPQAAEDIAAKRLYEDIAHHAVTDPAWQVFDHEGYWYSPSSLQRVSTVRIVNSRFDSFTIQNMVAHLGACPEFAHGTLHSAELVQRARDQYLRWVNLSTNIARLVQFQLWRYTDADGRWICPFCLGHVGELVLRGADDWQQAPPHMAQHLAYACPAYVPERPEPKAENLVQQEAGRHAPVTDGGRYQPPPPPTAPPTGRRSIERTPSRVMVMPAAPLSGGQLATPGSGRVRAPSGAVPVARPVSGPNALPVARPVTSAPGTDRNNPTRKSGETQIAQPVIPPPPPPPPPPEDRADDELFAGLPQDEAPDDGPVSNGTSLDWMDDVETGSEAPPTSGAHPGGTERHLARAVQQGMLQDAPVIEGFRFATRFEACSDVSGDFYEFIRLPDGRVGFAQGDVSGHGLHAGLIMSMAKKTLAIYAAAGHSPADTLSKVNDSLAGDLGGKIFISMVYAILDPAERTITWARAGHNPVIQFNPGTGAFAELKPKGMVVGMKAGPLFRKTIEEQVTPLNDGDLFVVYTDGITEAMNRQQVEYGLETLVEVIRKHAGTGPDTLSERIMDSVRQFRGGVASSDDCTLLVLAVD